jgi:hypothetical protein
VTNWGEILSAKDWEMVEELILGNFFNILDKCDI